MFSPSTPSCGVLSAFTPPSTESCKWRIAKKVQKTNRRLTHTNEPNEPTKDEKGVGGGAIKAYLRLGDDGFIVGAIVGANVGAGVAGVGIAKLCPPTSKFLVYFFAIGKNLGT